jgi:glycosyltransferase involved in cell wall biosynthesis
MKRKVALVHDWLVRMRGGEKVLENLAQLFPTAEIFTLICERKNLSSFLQEKKITTSFLQRWKLGQRKYPFYLPLFPLAVEQFNFRSFDLIISSSHCVAKGIIPPPEVPHITYIYTPMRYLWDLYFDYFAGERNILKKTLISLFTHYLRLWDVVSSQRVDFFIACSRYVQQRIKKYYRREAEVIYPPVDTSFYQPTKEVEKYFLVVSALVPYKRIDLAVEAFNQLKLPLLIVGSGPEEKKLKKIAGRNIKFLGWRKEEELKEYYARAQALIFPGKEDFGLSPVEAQAAGRPVIAYQEGGVRETVVENKTGLFFSQQTPTDLIAAVLKFQKMKFNPEEIRTHALKFDQKVFRENFKNFIHKNC